MSGKEVSLENSAKDKKGGREGGGSVMKTKEILQRRVKPKGKSKRVRAEEILGGLRI